MARELEFSRTPNSCFHYARKALQRKVLSNLTQTNSCFQNKGKETRSLSKIQNMKPAIIPLEPKTERRLVGKRAMSAAFGFCPRTADNYMAKGLPHIKLSARKTLFNLNEVEDWIHRTFSVSRLGKLDGSKGEVVK